MIVITAPLRPAAHAPAAPARSPCTCVAGRTCAPCTAWGPGSLSRARDASRDALRRRLVRLRRRLPIEECLLKDLKAEPLPRAMEWLKKQNTQYQRVKRLRATLRALEARVADGAPATLKR